jgi:prophage antirepressor-like protein
VEDNGDPWFALSDVCRVLAVSGGDGLEEEILNFWCFMPSRHFNYIADRITAAKSKADSLVAGCAIHVCPRER